MDLHKFSNFRDWLNERGIEISESIGYKLVSVDFKRAFEEGRLAFTPDGIIYTDDDNAQLVYVYIKYYGVSYKQNLEFPKIHTHRCSTIDSFVASGRFNKRYEVSNSPVNDIYDTEDGDRLYKDRNLQLCGNCKKVSGTGVIDSDGFSELQKESQGNGEVEVDRSGYTRDWPIVSNNYRRSVEFCCEKCGLRPKVGGHKIFWHTHHVNSKRHDNSIKNLKCLCIRCHSKVDDRHAAQFNSAEWKRQIATFNVHYPEK